MENVGEKDLSTADTFVTTHCEEALERHGIDETYVDDLLEQCDAWKRVGEGLGHGSGHRLMCITLADGVYWKLIIERNLVAQMENRYDLLTVYPRWVDMEDALECGRWSEGRVGRLAFYADQNG